MRCASFLTKTVLFFGAFISSCALEKPSAPAEKVWVEDFLEKYPELFMLADDKVRKTEEGQSGTAQSYSEQLFGKKFVEFDRTMMTLQCMQWILDGSDAAYLAFTGVQSPDVRLSRASFAEIHARGQELLSSHWGDLSEKEMKEAMQTALVLGDLGKSEKARLLFGPFGARAPDHDDFYGEAMGILTERPELCPSFARLGKKGRELLKKTAHSVHWGHITHLEGGSAMFRPLKTKGLASSDPIPLSFDLFVHACDVAGALGHVNRSSSLVYTEWTHRAMQGVRTSAFVLLDAEKTEHDAYDAYVALRAGWLGLNPADPLDRVLTRVGAMLRLFSSADGEVVRSALMELDFTTRSRIAAQLEESTLARTPTYMPAVLVNLAGNPKLGSSREERLKKAVNLGLPFLARVLEAHKARIQQGLADSNIPLNFNQAAGVAKNAPELLDGAFSIDHEGNVILEKKF